MPDTPNLIHEILPVGMLQCNCHVVGDPKTHDAIVIDPGDDAEKILEILKRHHLKVSAIVITHTHIDHVMGLHRLQQATNAPVYMHADDLGLYQMLDEQASWLGWKAPKKVNVDQLLGEGDAIRWGRFAAQVLHTPGHTQGSICLYMPSVLPEARAAALAAKSTERLSRAPFCRGHAICRQRRAAPICGEARSRNHSLAERRSRLLLRMTRWCYPGHGASTTIGEERQSNPFLVGKNLSSTDFSSVGIFRQDRSRSNKTPQD